MRGSGCRFEGSGGHFGGSGGHLGGSGRHLESLGNEFGGSGGYVQRLGRSFCRLGNSFWRLGGSCGRLGRCFRKVFGSWVFRSFWPNIFGERISLIFSYRASAQRALVGELVLFKNKGRRKKAQKTNFFYLWFGSKGLAGLGGSFDGFGFFFFAPARDFGRWKAQEVILEARSVKTEHYQVQTLIKAFIL